MFEDHEHYQEAKIVFSFWKFAVQKALDGSGAVWIIFRLFDGKEELREFHSLDEYCK